MIQNSILTKKGIQIISKKLENKPLTQQDSNYLSRFVRPKLRDMVEINAGMLLKKLEYNPKSLSIEEKIEKIILKHIKKPEAIIICGSAIQTNYKEYNDIDIIIAIKQILKEKIKMELKKNIEDEGKENNLNLDIQIYSKSSIICQYSHNPSLIYQLKDSKIIYGNIKIPNKINLTNLDLKMKLDWSEGLDKNANGKEIYLALRNALLVLLLINKKVDNYQLRDNLTNIIGYDLLIKLKNNSVSKDEKKLALSYLNLLTNHLENLLKEAKWGKIKIENH